MDYDQAELLLLAKPESLKSYPFGPDAAVFKVKGKMFAILIVSKNQFGPDYTGYPCINLKCDPDEALALRDVFDCIFPAYHMNKKHWVSVVLKQNMPDCEADRLIDRSYGLVVKGLKKAERMQLELHYTTDELYK